MAPSILRGESRVDRTNTYSLIPVSHDEDENEVSCEEFCGTPWRVARTFVGLIAVVVLLGIVVINEHNISTMSHIAPPRFFIHSLRVSTFNISQGELTATWNVDLAISNEVNSTFINIVNFKAMILYKDDIPLALSSPIQPENLLDAHGIFSVSKNEKKTLHLSFNTTGWEKDQPVVDDDVIQEIDEQMKVGVISFGLKINVEAEMDLNMMNVPLTMEPYCSNLEVDFAPLERGEAATILDNDVDEVKECFNNVDQLNDLGY
ncbi:hypothetical protein DEO72_LG9g155 [Vigna unguiculata]|uniref:Late embryogenesis abundant protein n=1 Tax=Vigna unguiculata TaxID=3917 RepID=A0A4D6MZ62_VIGUN|nr:hypothetical protein DEO72_LG9g155 [Vigna unguiculata]